MNFANSADPTIAYATNPITAGNNSFDIWVYGHYSGTYNQIGASILFGHITTALGTGLALKSIVTASYTTPSASANGALTVDITAAAAIGTGQAVLVGATSPQAAGKATTSTSNPAYTQFCVMQLQTTGSAVPGDTASIVIEVEYLENAFPHTYNNVGMDRPDEYVGRLPATMTTPEEIHEQLQWL